MAGSSEQQLNPPLHIHMHMHNLEAAETEPILRLLGPQVKGPWGLLGNSIITRGRDLEMDPENEPSEPSFSAFLLREKSWLKQGRGEQQVGSSTSQWAMLSDTRSTVLPQCRCSWEEKLLYLATVGTAITLTKSRDCSDCLQCLFWGYGVVKETYPPISSSH